MDIILASNTNYEQLISVLASILVLFLFISAAVEAIIESLDWITIPFFKYKLRLPEKRVSLQETMKLCKEFSPELSDDLAVKVSLINKFKQEISTYKEFYNLALKDLKKAQEIISELEGIISGKVLQEDIKAKIEELKKSFSNNKIFEALVVALQKENFQLTDKLKAKLQEILEDVNKILNHIYDTLDLNSQVEKFAEENQNIELSNKKRNKILRLISGLIGAGAAWSLQLNIFEILAENNFIYDSKNEDLLPHQAFSYILLGFAASAGSSYWHDKLAKVRQLKVLTKSIPQGSKP